MILRALIRKTSDTDAPGEWITTEATDYDTAKTQIGELTPPDHQVLAYDIVDRDPNAKPRS